MDRWTGGQVDRLIDSNKLLKKISLESHKLTSRRRYSDIHIYS